MYAQVSLKTTEVVELLSFPESNLKVHILEMEHAILHVPLNTDDIILASKASIKYYKTLCIHANISPFPQSQKV